MTVVATMIIRKILETKTNWSNASEGYRAVSVERPKHAHKEIKRNVSRRMKNVFFSEDRKIPKIVLTATICENGNVRAKPHV
jgi:hypothetical protein